MYDFLINNPTANNVVTLAMSLLGINECPPCDGEVEDREGATTAQAPNPAPWL